MKKKIKFYSQVIVFILFYFNFATASLAYSDRVLVIINEDVITQSEFSHRLQAVEQEIAQSGKSAPPGLKKQLLESMVSDRLQIQEANRRGIRISDQELNQAIQRFAQQQNVTTQDLVANLVRSGQSLERFQKTVRDSLTISRLTEFYTRTQVVVPEYEIEGFIAVNGMDKDGTEYQLAHLLIKQPEQNLELAKRVRQEIIDGLSFQQAVLTYSEGTDAQEGGVMGWRTPAKLPEVYVDALKGVPVGGITEVIQTANGLHILKLLDTKGNHTEIIQSNVSHILIASESKVAKSQAAKKLTNIRQRILNGEDFSSLARIYSDDSVSAANGGSLDWVSPGQMVKEFEETYTQLALGDISQPIETQYGVHIIKINDRRKKNITDQMIRGKADNFLRRQRADREFSQWVRELKEQAYVEYVSEPA